MRDRVSTSYLRANLVNASARAGLEPGYENREPRGTGAGYLLRFAMVSSLARELRVVPNSKL